MDPLILAIIIFSSGIVIGIIVRIILQSFEAPEAKELSDQKNIVKQIVAHQNSSLSVLTGVKFGFGFGIGFGIASTILAVLFFVVMGAMAVSIMGEVINGMMNEAFRTMWVDM